MTRRSRKKAKKQPDTIVGFDYGHAETALARAMASSTAPPSLVDLPGAMGTRQIVTAVATSREHGVVLGQAAVELRDPDELYLAFKSPELSKAEVRRPMTLFAQSLVEQGTQEGRLTDAAGTRWYFGAPSGWSKEVRSEYRVLLEDAGFEHVEVISESRAAMLYARDSGEVDVEADSSTTLLVIDLGSSTTDLTSVWRLKERPLDFGSQLGAGLLDREILERLFTTHRDGEELEELAARHRPIKLQLEFLCRRVKEDLFRKGSEALRADPTTSAIATGKFPPGRDGILVTFELSAEDMDEVIDTPLAALDGRSWREALRAQMVAAHESFEHPPDVVLLTGGASRMHFVTDLAREVFGAHRVHVGTEPEAAIARGLALAGRVSLRTAGFREEVRDLVESKAIENIVAERLPDLAERLGRAAADGIVERHVIPKMLQWRRGDIRTLDDTASQIAKAVHDDLTSKSNAAISEVVVEWQNEIRPAIDDLTRPICNRWHLPPASLQLRQLEIGRGRIDAAGLTASSASAAGLENMMAAVSAAIASVVATTLFGAGTAIIATTGPFAVLIAAAAVFGALWMGKDAALDYVKSVELPLRVRQLRSEQKLAATIRADAATQEGLLAAELGAQFSADGGDELIANITTAIGEELEALARDVELEIS